MKKAPKSPGSVASAIVEGYEEAKKNKKDSKKHEDKESPSYEKAEQAGMKAKPKK